MSHLIISGADRGKSITLKEGDSIELHLSENPTTGSLWQVVTNDPKIINVERKNLIPVADAGIGAGGDRVFELKAVAKGIASFVLKNFQKWEGEQNAVDSFDLNIIVV